MAAFVEEVSASKPSAPLGEDEARLLDALHGRGAVGEKLKADLEEEKGKAKYKIEVQFAKSRTHNLHTPNLASIMAWESGKRFHGGGDQRMVFCGYWRGQGYQGELECGRPVSDSNFIHSHLVCPYCHREQFLTPAAKQSHIFYVKSEGGDTRGLEAMPIANGSLVANLSPRSMAEFIAKIFRHLDSNADIYVKYHPTDIRCRDVPEAKKPDVYEKARQDRLDPAANRGLVIYPLANIVRDTLAGATIEGRILALLLA